jgi:hypothetical protein
VDLRQPRLPLPDHAHHLPPGPRWHAQVHPDTEFIHRRGAEILEKIEVNAANLPAMLEEHFDLRLPDGARLGPPGAPWATA